MILQRIQPRDLQDHRFIGQPQLPTHSLAEPDIPPGCFERSQLDAVVNRLHATTVEALVLHKCLTHRLAHTDDAIIVSAQNTIHSHTLRTATIRVMATMLGKHDRRLTISQPRQQ